MRNMSSNEILLSYQSNATEGSSNIERLKKTKLFNSSTMILIRVISKQNA